MLRMGLCEDAPITFNGLSTIHCGARDEKQRLFIHSGDSLASCLEGGCLKQVEQKSQVKWHD